ncbi:MAG: toll/interleukin-1 receptor domain-containing protein [Pirellulaceae bacterium]
MNHTLFISYRKSDEAGFSGRIYDRLIAKFGQSKIFMDVSNLNPGNNFVETIFSAIDKAGLVLSFIGKDWLNVSDDDGRRRLDREDDWVRLEIETAFALGKVVVPVLMGAAQPFRAEQLPRLMRPLVDRQFVKISHETFNDDVSRLVEAIEAALAELEDLRQREDQARKNQAAKNPLRRPLNRIEIDRRHADAKFPEQFVRILPKNDRFPSHLGRSRSVGPLLGAEALYVHAGDYIEYRGRFLKDILRDMYGYGYEAGEEQEWLAIVWKVDDDDWNRFRCAPATMLFAYHLLTEFSELPLAGRSHAESQKQAFASLIELSEANKFGLGFDVRAKVGVFASDWQKKAKAGLVAPPPGLPLDPPEGVYDYIGVARDHGYRAIFSWFGVDATSGHDGRGRSEYSARHLFFSNCDLISMNFSVQQLGRPDDLVALA